MATTINVAAMRLSAAFVGLTMKKPPHKHEPVYLLMLIGCKPCWAEIKGRRCFVCAWAMRVHTTRVKVCRNKQTNENGKGEPRANDCTVYCQIVEVEIKTDLTLYKCACGKDQWQQRSLQVSVCGEGGTLHCQVHPHLRKVAIQVYENNQRCGDNRYGILSQPW